MNKDSFEKIKKISEEFFGTKSDPEQIEINQENADELYKLHSGTIIYKFNEKDEPIAWVTTIPTSIHVMNDFLDKKISERELMGLALKEKSFEALYLCGVFVLPEYRNMGYGKSMLLQGIEKVSQDKDIPLYCWNYSEEGRMLIKSLSLVVGKEIKCRED
jgi:GNAT superfamily N-acetyltransferase